MTDASFSSLFKIYYVVSFRFCPVKAVEHYMKCSRFACHIQPSFVFFLKERQNKTRYELNNLCEPRNSRLAGAGEYPTYIASCIVILIGQWDHKSRRSNALNELQNMKRKMNQFKNTAIHLLRLLILIDRFLLEQPSMSIHRYNGR